MLQQKLLQALWQTALIVVMAGLIAVSVNHYRSDGIALIGDWSADARYSAAAGDSLVIGLEEAGRLFRQEAALFLDARPHGQYLQGHIRGALSLPWQEVERHFMAVVEQLEAAGTLVSYCDGESCELSHELALFLKEMGFENVRVLVNGWTVWQQAGLPIDDGRMSP